MKAEICHCTILVRVRGHDFSRTFDATESLLNYGEVLTFTFARKHIEMWLDEVMPAILTVYDMVAEYERGYECPGVSFSESLAGCRAALLALERRCGTWYSLIRGVSAMPAEVCLYRGDERRGKRFGCQVGNGGARTTSNL